MGKYYTRGEGKSIGGKRLASSYRIGESKRMSASFRQRIRRLPRHPPFRVQSLEVPDQQQPKLHPRRQAWSPHLRRVELPAPLFYEGVKPGLLQKFVPPLVDWMPPRPRQLRRRDPQPFLPFLLFSCSHCHAAILGPLPLPRKPHSLKISLLTHLHHGRLDPFP